jgi:hypothetical protein
MKKLLGVTLALAAFGAPALATAVPAAASVACVHIHVDVNGTTQDVDQCTPV